MAWEDGSGLHVALGGWEWPPCSSRSIGVDNFFQLGGLLLKPKPLHSGRWHRPGADPGFQERGGRIREKGYTMKPCNTFS